PRVVPSDPGRADGGRVGARTRSGRAGDRPRRRDPTGCRPCAHPRVRRARRNGREAATVVRIVPLIYVYGIHAVSEALKSRRVSRLVHVRGGGPRIDVIL